MLAGSRPRWIRSFSTRRFCAAYSRARLSIAAGSILALLILSSPQLPVPAEMTVPPPDFAAAAPGRRGPGVGSKCNRRPGAAGAPVFYPLDRMSQPGFQHERRPGQAIATTFGPPRRLAQAAVDRV